jgi:arylsulfatase A-like enzyme
VYIVSSEPSGEHVNDVVERHDRYWIVEKKEVAAEAVPERAVGQAARPNVLVIVTDDQREGLEVMPRTRQWFGSGGTTYANGIATTPMCCPGRASIMSGRYAHNNGVTRNSNANTLDQSKTMQAYLDNAGYRTGMFGKFFNSISLSTNPRFIDAWATFPNSQYNYTDGNWNVQGTIRRISQYVTDYIGDRAVDFIRGGSGQPWFLYIATPNAHGPMTPEAQYSQAPVPSWAGNPAVFEKTRALKRGSSCAAAGTVMLVNNPPSRAISARRMTG